MLMFYNCMRIFIFPCFFLVTRYYIQARSITIKQKMVKFYNQWIVLKISGKLKSVLKEKLEIFSSITVQKYMSLAKLNSVYKCANDTICFISTKNAVQFKQC